MQKASGLQGSANLIGGDDKNPGDILMIWTSPPTTFFAGIDRFSEGRSALLPRAILQGRGTWVDCDAHDAVPESALWLL